MVAWVYPGPRYVLPARPDRHKGGHLFRFAARTGNVRHQ